MSLEEKSVMIPLGKAKEASCHYTGKDNIFCLKIKQVSWYLLGKDLKAGGNGKNLPLQMTTDGPAGMLSHKSCYQELFYIEFNYTICKAYFSGKNF